MSKILKESDRVKKEGRKERSKERKEKGKEEKREREMGNEAEECSKVGKFHYIIIDVSINYSESVLPINIST